MNTLKQIVTGSLVVALSATMAFAGPPEEPRVLDFEAMEKVAGKKGGEIDILMAKAKRLSPGRKEHTKCHWKTWGGKLSQGIWR